MIMMITHALLFFLFSVFLANLGPDCGSALVWAGILQLAHLPLFITPSLLMVRAAQGGGVMAIILPTIGILSIILNPLFGIILPFVIVHNTDASDPSSCCWSGPDATAMAGIQFLLITDAVLYVPTVLCVGAWYIEAMGRKNN